MGLNRKQRIGGNAYDERTEGTGTRAVADTGVQLQLLLLIRT
jgi:hypothetical protein